jgi:hypothetical protein
MKELTPEEVKKLDLIVKMVKYRYPRCSNEVVHTVPLHFPTRGYLEWRNLKKFIIDFLFKASGR